MMLNFEYTDDGWRHMSDHTKPIPEELLEQLNKALKTTQQDEGE